MQRERQSSRGLASANRGQSVFDYSIGISLFIVVVLGVLVFVPTAFASFGGQSTSGVANSLAAERAADHLAGSALAGSESPQSFRTGCTLLLFGADSRRAGPTAEHCTFDPDEPFSTRIGLAESQPVNVTIEANVTGGPEREILCWDDDEHTLRAHDATTAGCGPTDSSDDVSLRQGSNPANQGNYAVAERYGRLAGERVVIVVRAW